MAGEMIAYPNTLTMCCPTADGSASVILASDKALRRMPPEVQRRALRLLRA